MTVQEYKVPLSQEKRHFFNFTCSFFRQCLFFTLCSEMNLPLNVFLINLVVQVSHQKPVGHKRGNAYQGINTSIANGRILAHCLLWYKETNLKQLKANPTITNK